MPNLARTPPQRVSPLPRSPAPPASQPEAEDPASSSQSVPSTLPAPTAPAPAASPARSTRQSVGIGNVSVPSTTGGSPSRPFAPRNPGVMRSPPSGSQARAASPQPEAGPGTEGSSQVQEDAVPVGVPEIEVQEASLVDIEVDQPGQKEAEAVTPSAGEKRKRADDEAFIEQQVQAGLSTSTAAAPVPSTTPTQTPRQPTQVPASTTPAVTPSSSSARVSAAAAATASHAEASSSTRTSSPPPIDDTPAVVEPRTPNNRNRRRSTRTAAEVAEAASIINAPIEPLETDETAEYGKRYEITMDTLDIASRAAALKWTRKDLEQCFPLISAAHPQTMKEVYEDTAKALRQEVLNQARQCFDSQDTGRALKMLDEAVNEAKEYKKAGGGRRADAWRPDLTPHAITAAANMAIYDESYERLRLEYIGLHDDCAKRFANIKTKQAELAAFEAGVSDGVVELEKSLEVLTDFPSAEMKRWAEDKMGEMHGVRPV